MRATGASRVYSGLDFTEALTRLYGAAHADFVGERKTLATALRAEGETALARRILKRTRPPVAVWAVNQLARRAPERLASALKAIDAERDAQLEVLAGADPDHMASARASSREALTAAREVVAKILEEGGHASSKGNIDRALDLLRRGALDADKRADLEVGVLAEAPEAPDLGAVAEQLDPALLRSALQAKPSRPHRRRGVDSFMAKAVRGKQARAPERAERPTSEPAAAPEPRRRVDPKRLASLESELEQRLSRAEAKAAEVKALTERLDVAREELRRMRRRAGDLQARLVTLRRRAEKAT